MHSQPLDLMRICAAAKGNQEIVPALVQAGANVNAAITEGRTPLKSAEEEGEAEIDEVLRKAGSSQHRACNPK
jgi:ankyrin repeat protein